LLLLKHPIYMTESPKLLISSSKELRKSHPETRSPKVIKGEKQNENPQEFTEPSAPYFEKSSYFVI